MEYTFKVWVDGNYYYEDEEYEVEIELTDEEHETLKKIVKEYDGDLSRGLMPILEKSNDDLYQLFYDRIFPDVFFTLFLRDDMFEPKPGDEGKSWDINDVDYLMETYGDNYCFDEAYQVYIPDEMMPPKMKLTKGMSDEDLLTYIRRWNSMREEVFDCIISDHSIPISWHDTLYEIIEKRLVEIAKKNIDEWDEDYLSRDGSDPFRQIFTDKLADEIYGEFQKANGRQ